MSSDIGVTAGRPVRPKVELKRRRPRHSHRNKRAVTVATLQLSDPPTTPITPITLDRPVEVAAPTRAGRRRSILPGWLITPRAIPPWVLVGIVLGTCTISNAADVISNVRIIAEGAPDAYLALLPPWALAIAMTADRGHRRHDVHDADVDKILAVLVAVLAVGSCQLIVGRLGAVAEYWHVQVLSVISWVVAVSILKFGSRAAARTRDAWLFLLASFPPFFLLAGQAMGGTRLAYGALTAAYGAVAMFLTLRERDIRWIVAPAYFGLAFAGTMLLKDSPTVVAYLLPAAVLSVLAIALFARTPPGRQRAPVPKHSVLTVAIVIIVSALVGLAPRGIDNHIASSDLMTVRADWVKELVDTGISVGAPQTYAWGPKVLGDHGSVVRYPITSGKQRAFLDVFSTRDYGRLADYCCGMWYATAPPPDLEHPFVTTRGVITQVAEMGNQFSPAQKVSDPAWHAHYWLWRTRVGSADVYQAVYLVASRDPKAPDNVAEPQAPTFRTGVLQPLAALIQDHAALHTATPYDTGGLDAISAMIITSAKGTPAA